MVPTWWRHRMKASPALLALSEGNPPVAGALSWRWPLTPSFDVFFDLYPDKRLSKQSRCRWFETPSRSLWFHCNDMMLLWHNERYRFPETKTMSSKRQNNYHYLYENSNTHYRDVIMSSMASQFIDISIVYSTVFPGADQWKHQSSAWLAFARDSLVTGEFPTSQLVVHAVYH